MPTDMEILQKAFDKEKGTQVGRFGIEPGWEYYAIGASREDVKRLVDQGYITIAHKDSVRTRYRLTEKGRELVWPTNMEEQMDSVSADDIIDAMSLIVGFDDIKNEIAFALETRRKINFLLEGPPACAKSLMLEGVRSVCSHALMTFGSRLSGTGLSDELFAKHPDILLMDEADKMRHDVFSVMLGLMESGEIIETKVGRTRGVKLKTTVLAACNDSSKMPREFLSRFAFHIKFPEYTRVEFLNMSEQFLSRSENAPPEVARYIGEQVFDKEMGDIRKVRAVWNAMRKPTTEEALRIINVMLKYSPDQEVDTKNIKLGRTRLPGM